MRRVERGGWIAVAIVLSGLAIPWFLWGSDLIIWGLPVWLWWHIGWMGLTALVFWLFTQRAWGIGIEHESPADEGQSENGSDPPSQPAPRGERQ